jgi:thaumarchaeosortase
LFDKKKSVSFDRKTDLKKFRINSSIIVTLLLIAPIMFTLIAYPDTFYLSWNVGRGELLFAMVFIVAELIGSKQEINIKKLYIIAGLLSLTVGYFVAIEDLGLKESIRAAAPIYNVQQVDSWIFMWDFIIMAVYVGVCLPILYGKKGYKIAPAGLLFLTGTAVILSLDAFFPQDTLGPLQYIVPIYLQLDQGVIRLIDSFIMDLGPDSPLVPLVTAQDNTLNLNGLNGPMRLTVFWPSAGVHSMIIYTLLMLIFLLKMRIPLKRKLCYFVIGSIGTALVNIIRIISLSLFALIVSANPTSWQSFHSVAGVIIFIPWLFIYVYSVLFLENRLARKLQALKV